MMEKLLALARPGQPVGTTGSLIGAGITLLVCAYFILSIFKPGIRANWKGSRIRLSAVACAAWAIGAAALSLCMFCQGIHFSPVNRHASAIVGTALAIAFLSGLFDTIYYWRHPGPSAMKSFRVCLKPRSDTR